jgi:hypothetical protein
LNPSRPPELNYQYYELATLEGRRCSHAKRLTTFIAQQAYNLFRDYTKYYAEITELGTLSRPLERFMTGYLNQNRFFTHYLDVDLQVALDALTAHGPSSMKDPDTLLTQAEPNPGQKRNSKTPVKTRTQ